MAEQPQALVYRGRATSDQCPEAFAHLDEAWEEIQEHAETIRDYVQAGGRYMGFCLGAYLAGSTPPTETAGFNRIVGSTSKKVPSSQASKNLIRA
ncbi:hypothetical protein HJFPF1_10869 [Paramyrothecium foliicola]|nr:hypothetical protein HJFPF1_10869 [Paramyrothecium foliicola]